MCRVWVELDHLQISHDSVVLPTILSIIFYQKDVSSFEGKMRYLIF